MNTTINRSWNILHWNVRGLNSKEKWNPIRNKIVDLAVDIICLQETKKDSFDTAFLRNICPPDFDRFEYLPSVGASGGILTAWKSKLFSGELIFSNEHAISVQMSSMHNNDSWLLTNVYAPCTDEGKRQFVNWFKNIQIPHEVDWLVVGDFNLMRKHEDRNKEGGDSSEMFLFNSAISSLGLNEITLQGRKYTWSNMQSNPLLQKIDWTFTSNSWNIKFPDTSVKGYDMTPSDHAPCLVRVSTKIPKTKVFRFENCWLRLPGFQQLISDAWGAPMPHLDQAKSITAKFKKLRKALKEKQASMANLKTVISNVKLVIQFLELLEEYRDLSLLEWNFRSILKKKLTELLEQQKIYWRQRGAIKWIKLGDATTKFFHANATIKMRGNLVNQLQKQDGSILTAHKDKEQHIWEEFKERLGTKEETRFGLNPASVLQASNDLEPLEEPFTETEIESVVKLLPNDKSPGPDGFSNEFMKASWQTIKVDIFNLCNAFHNHNICLRSINTSYITLIPKTHNPVSVNDYRPISLLNTSMKLITKLLANRLQMKITDLVHKNQYGFIKQRTIQDCLAWSFEYLHLCHHSRKPIVIIKLDFEKAFDKMSHTAMLTIMKEKGFGQRWLNWMQSIFASGTSNVLLNGTPGKTIHCLRGVRQGDPLSPLLFVLAADFLQSLVNKAKCMNLLKLPIPMQTNQDFPIIQYADDTLIIAEGDTRQLLILKSIINTFSEATGLKVNLQKSMMLPINMDEERLDTLARTFGCSKGSFPFTYLGLPLGVTKPTIQDFQPLINKCEARLGSVATFLSEAGRLELTNAVFTALPTFYMCTLAIPKSVIHKIDKFRKHCLWRGNDINARKPPKAAWKLVCKPKNEGGLGVIDIEKQNEALLMKNLDKFFNKKDTPWVQMIWEKHYANGKLPGQIRKGSFWWRDILKLLNPYKEMALIKMKGGESVVFWQDKWGTQKLMLEMPELFSFVQHKTISAAEVLGQEDLTRFLQLPISETAFQQLQQLTSRIDNLEQTQEQDQWNYKWGNNFSATKAYSDLMGHQQIHEVHRWLWKSFCQPKHKVFFWLLIKDRLSTRNILKRKNMHLQSYNCVLCLQNSEETTSHLFLHCAYARQCWQLLNMAIPPNSDFPEIADHFKHGFNNQFFMVTTILLCWAIWSTGNNLIFRGIQPTIEGTKEIFKKELLMLEHRVKASNSSQFHQWIQLLV